MINQPEMIWNDAPGRKEKYVHFVPTKSKHYIAEFKNEFIGIAGNDLALIKRWIKKNEAEKYFCEAILISGKVQLFIQQVGARAEEIEILRRGR